jgi:hypothetical protein
MNFEIIKDNFKDTTIKVFIVNLLKFFNQTNEERISKIKDKGEKIKILQELVNYMESGLRAKYSLNFNVFVNEYPSYALKYESKSILILRHETFDLLVYRNPNICIPTKYIKDEKHNKHEEIEKYLNEKSESLKNEHIKVIKYFNKSTVDEKLINLKFWDDKKLLEIILKNIAYFTVVCDGKDITDLALPIQYDLSNEQQEYE